MITIPNCKLRDATTGAVVSPRLKIGDRVAILAGALKGELGQITHWDVTPGKTLKVCLRLDRPAMIHGVTIHTWIINAHNLEKE